MKASRSVAVIAVVFSLWSMRTLPHLIFQARNGGTIAVVFCAWLLLLPLGLYLHGWRDARWPDGLWVYMGVCIAVLGALADVTVVRHIGAAWILAGAIVSPAARWVWLAAAVAWLPGCERFWAQWGLENAFFRLLPVVAAGIANVIAARQWSPQRSGS
jgi:hypothetical protein